MIQNKIDQENTDIVHKLGIAVSVLPLFIPIIDEKPMNILLNQNNLNCALTYSMVNTIIDNPYKAKLDGLKNSFDNCAIEVFSFQTKKITKTKVNILDLYEFLYFANFIKSCNCKRLIL